jgi:hypothetical protein
MQKENLGGDSKKAEGTGRIDREAERMKAKGQKDAKQEKPKHDGEKANTGIKRDREEGCN